MKKLTLGDRVRKLRKERGLSQMDLAKAVGMRQQGIQSIEEGKSQRPRKLREIAAALRTTEDWLLGETPLNEIPAELFQVGEIPVIGEVAAGLWLEVGTMPEEPLEMLPFVPALSTKASYALRVRGNSVDKIAPDGAYLICADIGTSGAAIENDDLVIVERLQAQGSMREVTVKRVRLKKDGLVLLPESTDPRWTPVEINSHNTSPDDVEVRVIAHVVWVTRRAT
jgi:SOS-response transcriptional repressor LexA